MHNLEVVWSYHDLNKINCDKIRFKYMLLYIAVSIILLAPLYKMSNLVVFHKHKIYIDVGITHHLEADSI